MLCGVLTLPKHRVSALASLAVHCWLFLSIVLCPASAWPSPRGNVHAIPAFAHKYGMPCS